MRTLPMVVATFAITLLLDACGSDAASSEPVPDASFQDASTSTCVWGLEELLAEVGVESSDRVDCGNFNGAQLSEVMDALDCLSSADPAHGAQLRVNRCIDCSIPSTYVVTPSGEKFHVRMEADAFGDDEREASVESCVQLVSDAEDGIRCEGATTLYSCKEALQ